MTYSSVPIRWAKLDFRLPPGVPVEQVLHALRAHLDQSGFADMEIRPDPGYPAARTSLQAPLVQALIATYRAHGHTPVIYPLEATPHPIISSRMCWVCLLPGAAWARRAAATAQMNGARCRG